MNVLARSRSGTSGIRRRRRDARKQPDGKAEAAQKAAPARTDMAAPTQTPPSRRRREAGPPPDLAVYSCRCGLVFEAPVSTSVGCPHCGRTQAW
jgi:hypothetical protein